MTAVLILNLKGGKYVRRNADGVVVRVVLGCQQQSIVSVIGVHGWRHPRCKH